MVAMKVLVMMIMMTIMMLVMTMMMVMTGRINKYTMVEMVHDHLDPKPHEEVWEGVDTP